MDVFRDYSSLTFIGLPHTFFYVGSMKRPFLIKGRTYVFINSVDGLLRHQKIVQTTRIVVTASTKRLVPNIWNMASALIIPVKAIR